MIKFVWCIKKIRKKQTNKIGRGKSKLYLTSLRHTSGTSISTVIKLCLFCPQCLDYLVVVMLKHVNI